MPLWIKIAVPVMIAAVVAGIFFYKKASKPKAVSTDALPFQITELKLDDVKAYGKPVIIDFGSYGCTSCVDMIPVMESLHDEFKDSAVIQFMDVWEDTEGIDALPLQMIPTQVFYNTDGTPYQPGKAIADKISFRTDKDGDEVLYTLHIGELSEAEIREILKDMGV